MKAGKAITFVDADGSRHEATCAKVRDDVSESGGKVLDVNVDGEAEPMKAVPYVKDRGEGKPYWQLTTDPVLED